MLKEISRSYQGFTLIEVLVSMVIMATGLLGLAMLQGRSLSTNQDAYLYSQANLLMYEMSDRIKANRAYWGAVVEDAVTGFPCTPPPGSTPFTVGALCYAVPATVTTAPTPACTSSATSCTPAQMATQDLYYWQTTVAAMLPSGIATIRRMVVADTTGNCKYDAMRPSSLCLKITWDSKTPNANGTAGSAAQELGMTP